MIIMGFLEIVGNLLTFIVGLLPSNVPSAITYAIDWIDTYLNDGVKILMFYFNTGVVKSSLIFLFNFILILNTIKIIKYIVGAIPILSMNTKE